MALFILSSQIKLLRRCTILFHIRMTTFIYFRIKSLCACVLCDMVSYWTRMNFGADAGL